MRVLPACAAAPIGAAVERVEVPESRARWFSLLLPPGRVETG